MIKWLSLFFTIFASPLAAQYISGNVILRLCTSQNQNEFGTCNGYVAATADIAVGLSPFAYKVCPRPGVSYDQYTDIVIDYLKSNPEIRDEFGALLIAKALSEAFPCR